MIGHSIGGTVALSLSNNENSEKIPENSNTPICCTVLLDPLMEPISDFHDNLNNIVMIIKSSVSLENQENTEKLEKIYKSKLTKGIYSVFFHGTSINNFTDFVYMYTSRYYPKLIPDSMFFNAKQQLLGRILFRGDR